MTERGALLPPPVAGWPVPAFRGGGAHTAVDVEDALSRIRAEHLWWPAPRAGAEERAEFTSGMDPADVRPESVTRFSAEDGPLAAAAIIGGMADGDAAALLAQSRWIDPWRGGEIGIKDGVEALAFLHAAARANVGGHRLVGMSPWKRRCLTPFLAGPDGPPGETGRPVVWGASDEPGTLRVEDGFIRSVGLGLRHTPPASLTFDETAPYFDATRRNGFEETVARADFDERLLARARALRERILELRLSKYNLAASAALPEPSPGRERVLVPGQVETDASIRLGGAEIKTNQGLVEAARAALPDAFIIYKPHPDVLTGLREGDAPQAGAFADHIETGASAPDCLDWADRVVTITSLMGFEALLRGKAVTTLGRPFYSGWGLTTDISPPVRDRTLTLGELTAAALILYPRYIDPATQLPAPPEVTVEALAAEMASAGSPRAKLRRLWRDGVSWVLNRF